MISNTYRAKKLKEDLWIIGELHYRGEVPYIISTNTGKIVFIEESTICKSLDIKDKNNVTIFEGDIILVAPKGSKKGLVQWNTDVLRWELNHKIPCNTSRHRTYIKSQIEVKKAHLYKVVGNIIDNEELCLAL